MDLTLDHQGNQSVDAEDGEEQDDNQDGKSKEDGHFLGKGFPVGFVQSGLQS